VSLVFIGCGVLTARFQQATTLAGKLVSTTAPPPVIWELNNDRTAAAGAKWFQSFLTGFIFMGEGSGFMFGCGCSVEKVVVSR
jgi:hypothetical protein